MKKSKKLFAAVLLFIMVFAFFSCGTKVATKDVKQSQVNDSSESTADSSEVTVSDKNDHGVRQAKANDSSRENEEECNENKDLNKGGKASLICVGDNLIHDNIYKEAWKKGNYKNYDFTSMYEEVKDYIQECDISIVNQETLVTDAVKPQSYPTFATPTAAGDELVDNLGFNVVSMCNNHVLDQGGKGLISSLDYWDTKDVIHYGAYRDDKDANNIRIKEVNGITFAFLGYMDSTNGLSLGKGEPGALVYLSDEKTIHKQIETANKMADVVVVSCHYGTEVMNELNQQQKELTPKLVKWGADLIIGTSAHACSTCGYIDKPDGGQAFVYYGLGNFLSTMYDKKSLTGIMGRLDVVKDPSSGKITFENVKAIPIISHFEADTYNSDWHNCKIYLYKNYTDKLIARNFVKGFTRETIESCLSYIPKEFLSTK